MFENIVIKKIALIFGLCLALTEAKADCVACWTLELVEVTLADNTTKTGYMMWNDQWLNVSVSGCSFDDKVKKCFQESHLQGFVLYKQIYALGSHLPCEGVVTTQSSIDSIHMDKVKEITQLPDQKEKISGAGEITTQSEQSIKLLNKKPFCFYREEDTVSETYFLSYNNKIDVAQLQEIGKTRDYWLKRSSFEKQGVIIIMISWD